MDYNLAKSLSNLSVVLGCHFSNLTSFENKLSLTSKRIAMEQDLYLQAMQKHGKTSIGLESYIKYILKSSEHDKSSRIELSKLESRTHVLVAKGLVRLLVIDLEAENDTSIAFYQQGDFIINPTLSERINGKLFLEFVENTTLYSLGSRHSNNLLKLFPEFSSIDLSIHNFIYRDFILHILDLCRLDASQRYNSFEVAFPKIVLNSPMKNIATYLGIDNKTLSRIRSGRLKK